MKLITRKLFDSVYGPAGDLRIGEYEPRNYAGVAYYFRLGALDEGQYVVPIEDNGLTIDPLGFVRVYSLESFHASHKILGHFGSTSTLVGVGAELVHAPFIDPGFGGLLQVGLRNNLDRPINLRKHTVIGKALFFDVADSEVDIQAFPSDVLGEVVDRQQALEGRKSAEDSLRELDESDPGR